MINVLFNLQGGKCYCLNALANGAKRLSNSQCRTRCPGDLSQICGGKGSLSVFNHRIGDDKNGNKKYSCNFDKISFWKIQYSLYNR